MLRLVSIPSRVEEVVDELLHHWNVYLRVAETKRALVSTGIGVPPSSARLALKSWKSDLEKSQVRRHKRSLQQTNPAGNALPSPAAVLSLHHRHRWAVRGGAG